MLPPAVVKVPAVAMEDEPPEDDSLQRVSYFAVEKYFWRPAQLVEHQLQIPMAQTVRVLLHEAVAEMTLFRSLDRGGRVTRSHSCQQTKVLSHSERKISIFVTKSLLPL